LGFADLEEKNMEIGACFREVRLLVTTIIIVRRQSGCFIAAASSACFNTVVQSQVKIKKPGSKPMFAAIFACWAYPCPGLFLFLLHLEG
jgi:hypothetical protein